MTLGFIFAHFPYSAFGADILIKKGIFFNITLIRKLPLFNRITLSLVSLKLKGLGWGFYLL